MVAADLGFSPEMIEFKTVDTKNREAAISKGEVDLYIGTYTINDERKKEWDSPARTTRRAPTFWSARTTGRSAGRLSAGQDGLLGQGLYRAPGDQEARLQHQDRRDVQVQRVRRETVGKEVDAVTTDDAILMGYAAQRPDKLRVVGARSPRALRRRHEQG